MKSGTETDSSTHETSIERETAVEPETTVESNANDGSSKANSDEELPTASAAIEQCAATFDTTATDRLPNTIDRWNAYAGSSHAQD